MTIETRSDAVEQALRCALHAMTDVDGPPSANEKAWLVRVMHEALSLPSDHVRSAPTPSARDRALVRIGARARAEAFTAGAFGDDAVDDLVRMVDRELAGGAK